MTALLTALAIYCGTSGAPQASGAEVYIRSDAKVSVELLASKIRPIGKIESRKYGTSIYLIQLDKRIDEDGGRTLLGRIHGVRVLGAEEEPVDLTSLRSVDRKISALLRDEKEESKKGNSKKANEEKAGVDYLRSYRYFVGMRAFPNDKVDWSAYQRAREHVAKMQAAVFGHPGANGKRALTGATWTFIGPKNLTVPYTQYYGTSPVTGRFNAVAFDPNNSQIIYAAGAQGGLWKSIDGGNDWTWLSASWQQLGVNCIVIDPLDGDTIYVGMGDYHGYIGGSYGIMKSSDGGVTWSEIATPYLGYIGVARILIDPTNDQTIIAGTGDVGNGVTLGYGNIYRSTNAGQTWSIVENLASTFWPALASSTPSGSTVRFYAVAAGSAGTPGTPTASRVYKSDDHGASWQVMASPINNSDGLIHWAYSVAASPTNKNNVYVLDSEHDTLYSSTNQGSTWKNITASFPTGNNIASDYNWSQNYYDYHLECGSRVSGSTTVDVLYVGEIDLVESANTGVSWQSIGGPSYDDTSIIHNDQHDLAVSPTNPNLALFSNDGGVYEVVYNASNNPPNTVINLNFGLSASMFYHLAAHPTDPNIVIGGTQDNATPVLLDDLNDWGNVGGGDGGGCAIDQTNPNIQYATAEDMAVFKTTDAWSSPQSVITPNIGSDPPPFVAAINLDPSNQNVLYTGTDYLYSYSNTTLKWTPRLGNQRLTTPVTKSNPYPQLQAIAVAPTDSTRIYTGSSDGELWMSTNTGATWTQLNVTSTTLPNEAITSISVSPSNSSDILIGLSGTDATGHLWRCSNTLLASPNFVSVSSSGINALPSVSLNAIARDIVNPLTSWWVGTDSGVFFSSNSGASWQNAGTSNGLPNVIVDELIAVPGTGYMIAGTYGRGVWRLQVQTPVAVLTGESLSASSTRKGNTVQGTVTLSADAPAGGIVVQLASSNTSVATVPASVTVPAGYASANFTVTTVGTITTPGGSVISATYSGVTVSQTLDVTVPTITGVVTFSDYIGAQPTTVTLNFRLPGASSPFMTMTVTVDGSGNFTAQNVPAEAYDVYIQTGTWLRRTLSLNLSTNDVNGAIYTLINGDIAGHNRIDITDRRLLSIANGSKPGDPNWNPRADLNGDGMVGSLDYAILYKNYGRIGDP